jgi:hypothetical protein
MFWEVVVGMGWFGTVTGRDCNVPLGRFCLERIRNSIAVLELSHLALSDGIVSTGPSRYQIKSWKMQSPGPWCPSSTNSYPNL